MQLLQERRYTGEHARIYEESFYALARQDFWTFRTMVRPGMILGWWQKDVADQLTKFWRDYKAGRRPKLVLGAPPQHGKSDTMKDFAAWAAGKDPDAKIIFASYGDELGIGANLYLQRTMPSPMYRRIFPRTRLALAGDGDGEVGRSRRTTSFLEFVGKRGSFRNTTVNGMITGHGLDIGVVDDPIKGRAEAQSKPIRDKTWAWLTDDFFSRFSDHAGMLMIMTRWHVDDPVGRWIERFKDTKVLNYRAIAERRERERAAGEALFPELKSLAFLAERRKALTEASWQALYQQHPIVVGGGIFPIEKLRVLPVLDRSQVLKTVRYWDKAGTEDDGACTAGALMHKMKDGTFILEHVARGQWGALERERHIKSWAERDRANCRVGSYEVGVEQEPGSGGKESAESTIRNLAGFRVYADKVTGSKEIRAEPLAAQVQNGSVWLVAGSYVTELLDEMEAFPSGKFRDQVDACTGAFNRLVSGPVYNLFGGALD